MTHPYSTLAAEYTSWVERCQPIPSRRLEIENVAARLVRPDHLNRFAAVTAKINVPGVVQATICEREDGCDFSKSPAQGDPWNRVSTHVPRGIGPFSSWEESAIYSWTEADNLAHNSVPWSLPYASYKWEYYNGGGYRARGLRTPYVVGGSNLQQPGKYTSDGGFDGRHWDTQLGTLVVAMMMIDMVPSLRLDGAIAVVTAPPLVPVMAPPIEVGGDLTGARWVQAALNVVGHITPPLKVDGSYGRLTRAAVRTFQKTHGLPVTGRIDDKFCALMDAGLAAARPQA